MKLRVDWVDRVATSVEVEVADDFVLETPPGWEGPLKVTAKDGKQYVFDLFRVLMLSTTD